ncbi:MAG: phosphate ABC transporter permease PstA [Bacteriovoracia bacterium]
MDASLYRRRKIVNRLGLGAACLAMMIGLLALGAILFTLFRNGIPALQMAVFREMTPPPGNKGGLLNAIVGSLMLTGIGTLIGTPIGILAGTYLAEFGRNNKLAEVIRFVNSILLSAPSVVIGFFIYTVVVARMGHFSGWAGTCALATILIPLVVSNTENMLLLVPNNLREAAAALGAPQWKITVSVTYRAARNGIFTGILLGIARISGESAPLLFTALNNQFWNTDLNKPMANLPVVIFQFAMSPYDDWQHLAWAGALLITLAVLFLNIIARFALRARRG